MFSFFSMALQLPYPPPSSTLNRTSWSSNFGQNANCGGRAGGAKGFKTLTAQGHSLHDID